MSGANSTYADFSKFQNFYSYNPNNRINKEIVNCISLDEIIKQNNINEIYKMNYNLSKVKFALKYL